MLKKGIKKLQGQGPGNFLDMLDLLSFRTHKSNSP